MNLTTIPNVTNQQWKEQAERFAKITDNVNSLTFAKSGVNEMPAIIELEIVQPLTKGFKGRVKYIQQFQEIIETSEQTPILDADGNPTFETTIIQTPTTRRHVVVDYYENITKDMISLMFDQVIQAVPVEIDSYMDKQDWCIKYLFLQQVVSKLTFNLSETDWQ
jgi:hypothetical protein